MLLDLIFAVFIIIALYKGYQRGLIVGIFSLVAVIIGIAAAMKLSIVAADYIKRAVKIPGEWLPVISFVVVFILVVLLVRLGANLIQKTIEIAMLGWLNKLGGIFFYMAIYTIVFSILLFYAEQMKILQPEVISKSVVYSYVQPWGPKVINGLGSIIPLFKDLFSELEKFFEGLKKQITFL